ncbi:MAG: AAA family ATPase, partial [Oligoflexia bacterium]|nr:AAA family ATPase [Oligoflexia bacterium]
MVKRLQQLKTKQNLFLFGARGTGKSTLLKKLFSNKNTLWIDLLDYKQESLFLKNPDRLSFLLAEKNYSTVIIDEIQKAPRLLDVIHKEIEKNKKIKFVMTGSS